MPSGEYAAGPTTTTLLAISSTPSGSGLTGMEGDEAGLAEGSVAGDGVALDPGVPVTTTTGLAGKTDAVLPLLAPGVPVADGTGVGNETGIT